MGMTRRGLGRAVLGGGLAFGAVSSVAAPAKPRAATGAFGLDLAGMDPSIGAGDDFYRHVNARWLSRTQIPADRAGWGEFARLSELNAERVHGILDGVAKAPGDPLARKLGDLYASLLDEAAIEGKGLAPVQPDLRRVQAIANRTDLARALAQLSLDWWSQPRFGDFMYIAPINPGILPDLKDPSRYIPTLTQGGLGVPNRDYLLADSEAFAKVRTAYRAHLATMFRLGGMDDAEGRAGRVYALEERLARLHWTPVQQRNILARYNVWERKDFATKAPGLDWEAFFETAGFGAQPQVIVGEPSAIVGAAEIIGSAPLQDWRDYLSYRVLRTFAPIGPRAFVDADFDFTSRTLAGTPELAVRWKRAAQFVDLAMGPALGELYLARYFPPAARREAERMTGEIKAAMGRRIAALAWMAPQTKAKALEKLAAVRIEVGSETPPRSYDGLSIDRGDAYGNLLRASRFENARQMAQLPKPVDRGRWTMLPHTINAQANPLLVKIMFPAGIMQGLFFDPAADPAVNYGAIGVVMGHELSHIFDDQGALFDAKGALKNWWTPADYKSFNAATAALATQYDAYRPLPDAPIQGKLTLGENIGDLAGLALALDAYHASLGGRKAPILGGLSGDQRFFLAYAQSWRNLQRENSLRSQLATNPHSPSEWRVMTVRNLDAWYAAFDVKPGQKMYLPPDQRVRIW
jgi:putative endopeptidase